MADIDKLRAQIKKETDPKRKANLKAKLKAALAQPRTSPTPEPEPVPEAPPPAPAPVDPTPPPPAPGVPGFTQNVTQAKDLALQDIMDYFSDRGLDPTAYQSDIDRAIQQTLLGIPEGATNLPGYFTDIASNLYQDIAESGQIKNMTALNNMFMPGFEQNYIPNTMDDAILAEILAGGRTEADKYIQNLLDRGVITPAGFTAAQNDVVAQEARIKAMLDQLGGQVLTSGREKLGDIANQAKLFAGQLMPGQAFDPNTYNTQIQSALADFSGNLGNQIRALLPEGSLFKTGGLAARAGAGQGAQNTKFSPNALAGIFEEDEEDTSAQPLPIF